MRGGISRRTFLKITSAGAVVLLVPITIEGCPNNAKGSPAVTFLRDALLSERCQLRYNAQVARAA
jgi:hypothetical protein